MKSLIFLICLASSVVSTSVFADDNNLYLAINGRSRHYNVDRDVFGDLNENNRGWGLEYDLLRSNKVISVISFSGGQYFNSIRRTSYYFGVSPKLRFVLAKKLDNLHIDIGFSFLLVNGYNLDFKNSGWMPIVLPVLSFGGDHAAINVFWVPPIEGVTPQTIGLQFKVLVLRF